MYSKTVRLRNTSVIVEIFRDGDQISTKRFDSFFGSSRAIEKDFKSAHKWADEVIRTLNAQEVFQK